MNDCKHQWIVYSTALIPPVIMLRCEKCDISGTVNDYTQSEWNDAYYADSSPYRWHDNERVIEGYRNSKKLSEPKESDP